MPVYICQLAPPPTQLEVATATTMPHAMLILLAWHPDLVVPMLTLHVAAGRVGVPAQAACAQRVHPRCGTTAPGWWARPGLQHMVDR